ncbi:hypothetical protein [Nonomuraea lactucae]|uniref:hypothetical protein n=1 Tax=Nonomuraea lactucae TaxID=2249762 RepID=UPI000DE2E97C|nr:hypothetical protein [Nonomuraea lactucae]
MTRTKGSTEGASRTHRNVPALLLALREESFTGTVEVSGAPGGSIHLRNGLIAAIETPGAPTAESTMLRSGRVSDEDWTTARAEGQGQDGRQDGLGPVLVARGILGAAELEVICTAAVFDGAFAMALSTPGSWEVREQVSTIVVPTGIEPSLVAKETTRRLAVIAQYFGAPGEFARTRIRPAPGANGRAVPLVPRYQALLDSSNGRRTPRDIAFTLGRGIFGVMKDLGRMNTLGLLQWESRAPTGRPSTAPRTARPSAGSPAPDAPLPRRVPRQKGRGPNITDTKANP